MTNEERLAEIEAWALRDRENPTLLENTSYKMACTGTTCTISDLKSWQSYGPMYEHAGDTLWLVARVRELEAQAAAAAAFVDAWYEDVGGDMNCIPAREFAALERALGRTPSGMMSYFDDAALAARGRE